MGGSLLDVSETMMMLLYGATENAFLRLVPHT